MFSIICFLLLLLIQNVTSISIRLAPFDDQAVRDVLRRMPEWVSKEFDQIRISPSKRLQEGRVTIAVNSTGYKVVSATSAPDALYGIHYYLRTRCASSISWTTSSFSNGCIQATEEIIELKSPRIRYFGNPCTYSYSFAWWQWEDWERFIDWLALSGFNTVLAPVGQEYIWKEVWTGLGVSPSAIDKFIAGPPFQAWHRMGNLAGWGGPTSDNFLREQFELNLKIVERMKSLGIVPVLPTFSGFVPPELERSFPGLKLRQNPEWNGFNGTFSLAQTEPLYKKIAKIFIKKQQTYYGMMSSVYSADPFNEMMPPEMTPSDYMTMAKTMFSACNDADPNCVWLLQGWTFAYDAWTKPNARAFLTAIPKGRLLILDQYAEQLPVFSKFDNFFGHYFVWCVLHNFGGSRQLRGNLRQISKGWQLAVQSASNLVGGGLSMEAIDQNYALYQFTIDTFYADTRIDLLDWTEVYVQSRYNVYSKEALGAWLLLMDTFYSEPPNIMEERLKVFLYQRPRLLQRIKYWFDTKKLGKMLETFSKLNETLHGNVNFRRDFSDVLREHMQYKIGNQLMLRVYEAYGMNDTKTLQSACLDIDLAFQLLDTVPDYSVSQWIDSARNWGSTKEEEDKFEINARYMLTLWGPDANVLDYSQREWSGIIINYYRPRWNYFCESLLQSPLSFKQGKFDKEVLEYVERPYTQIGHL